MYSTQPNGAEGATINPATINPAALNSGMLRLASLSVFYCLFLSLRRLRPSCVHVQSVRVATIPVDPSSKETRMAPRAGCKRIRRRAHNQSFNQSINHMRPSRVMFVMVRLSAYTTPRFPTSRPGRQKLHCGRRGGWLHTIANANVMLLS